MGLNLELKQTQKIMPKMIQNMEILQMGTLELQEHVEKTLLENPALDMESEILRPEHPELIRKLTWLTENGRQNQWYHQEDARDLIELIAAPEEETLYDHLKSQLDFTQFPPRLALAVDCVLTGLNAHGFLEESTTELAARCGQPTSVISEAEKIVQALEPAGIAARTLSECLCLQLRRIGGSALALIIAERHLEPMAQKSYEKIAQLTTTSKGEVQQACEEIRVLNPRPGSAYAPREAPGYIIPDLLVTEENGCLTVTPGDDFLPILKVSSYYEDLLRTSDDPEVRDYLFKKVRQAQWLITSIEQRKSTMLNCAKVIVRRQEAFFRSGNIVHLVPLTMAEVAAELGVHESTVSRAIREKNIQCIRGVFPLFRFFIRALPSGHPAVTSQQIKAVLRDLIGKEDPCYPLSDQKLCTLLANQGLILSRRAIAKYRSEIGIPSAVKRKQS